MRTPRVLMWGGWLILIVALIGLLIVEPPGGLSLPNAWKTNRHALETAKGLLAHPVTGNAPEESPAGCPDYPTGIRSLYQEGLSPGDILQRIERLSACWPPERASILTGQGADALWALGRHREVCESLAAGGAAPRMLSLAEKSSTVGDWDAVALYLDCLPKLARADTWVSPWIVARLYFGLGRHLEEGQTLDAAIDAYHQAALWHPPVWSAPYLRETQLLWQQGDQVEAIHLLVDAVSRATDPTASFQLWRQLGQFWIQQGNREDALCAYRKAAGLVNRLPAGVVSENGRNALREDLATLEASESPAACFANYPELASP